MLVDTIVMILRLLWNILLVAMGFNVILKVIEIAVKLMERNK